MTINQKLQIPLDEITTILLECHKCGARLTLRVERIKTTDLRHCPACKEVWLSNALDNGDYPLVPLARLVQLLPNIPKHPGKAEESRNMGGTLAGCRLIFEIDPDERRPMRVDIRGDAPA